MYSGKIVITPERRRRVGVRGTYQKNDQKDT